MLFAKKNENKKEEYQETVPLAQNKEPHSIVTPKTGTITTFTIDSELYENLRSLSSRFRTSQWVTLLAAFKALLYRYGAKGDINVHISAEEETKNQSQEIQEFSLTLTEQFQLNENTTFTELLELVKSNTDITLTKDPIFLKMEKSLPFSPLIIQMQGKQGLKTKDINGVKSSERKTPPQGMGPDVTFKFIENEKILNGSILYSNRQYTEETITRLKDHFLQVLRSVAHTPEDRLSNLRMLTQDEEQQLLVTFNQPANTFAKSDTIVDLFEKQVQKTPDAVAVIFGETQLTYKQLDVRSNQLSHYLKSKGVVEETLVPIYMDRSLEMVVAILGILKAGGAYVPIDPGHPKDRVNFVLEETQAFIVVTKKGFHLKTLKVGQFVEIDLGNSQDILNNQPKDKLQTNLKPYHLAYCIYTSGSTGTPKGVLIEHAQLVSSTQARNSYYRYLSSILLIPSFSFDASVGAIFGSLTNGGSLIISSLESIQDASQLEVLLKQADTILCVPSYYKFLLDEGLVKNSKLSTVIVGGEKLTQEVVSTHFNQTKNIALYNEYGPSEATVWSTVSKIEPDADPITIGSPIEHARGYILDPSGNLLPIGVTGELHIAGGGVARGYLNRPALTSQKFVANPFSTNPGSKMYKTGDLCYWLPDGSIVYVGRLDEQVKIQGNRVELGEIENVLQKSGLVKQAVVIGKEIKKGNQQLVAYIVPNGSFDRENILKYLKDKLPDYMIPHLWLEVEHIPLTPNGKIDKHALPNPDINDLSGNKTVGPQNPTEQILADIWKNILHLDQVGIKENFFDLGGNSLLAMRVISSIRRELRRELTIKEIFQHPTIARLAALLHSSSNETLLLPIQKESAPLEQIPLSFSQESLWFIDQLEGSVPYHLPLAFKIDGPLVLNALEKALKAIVERHDVLRTVIHEKNGQYEQHTLKGDQWQLAHIDGRKYQFNESSLQHALQKIIQEPFNLAKDYMFRASLIRLDDEEHILVLVMHHIAFDAWSTSVLMKEFAALYKAYHKNVKPSLPPLPIRYADFAIWQKKVIDGNFLENKTAYWKEKLKNAVPLQLPTDYLRSDHSLTKGAVSHFSIDRNLKEQIHLLAQNKGATLFMILLAAFKVMLYRYSSQEDICVGTAVAGRQQPEAEDLVGYFINTLALRSLINGKTSFTEFLEQIKATTLEAYENQEVPFEKVVAAVGGERIKNKNPLFQVMFLMQNVPDVPALELTGTTLSPLEVPQHTSKFDLTFAVTETSNGLIGTVEYRSDLYRNSTIEQMMDHYGNLLHAIVNEPEKRIGNLSMLSSVEEHRLLTTYNGTAESYPIDKTIVDLLEEQAINTPHAKALAFKGQHLTFQQLNHRSNQLAHLLRSKGVKEETMVLLCIERSMEMIIGILGILKAGGAYIPIDPDYPQERIDFIQKDTAATLVVTNKKSKSKLQHVEGLNIIYLEQEWSEFQHYSRDNVNVSIHPHHLAYVIYTSGSTGTPKGVMIEHANLFSFICWCRQEFASSRFEIAYSSTSICFDLSIFEIFYPLSVGKPVRIIEDGLHLGEYLPIDSFVLINTVPSVIQSLLNEGIDISNISVINMAGEPVPQKVLEKLNTEVIEVRNLYGPTEDTTYSTVYQINKDKLLLIGKPISNTSIYIISPDNELNPEGVAGEICLSGAGLARGYLNREELTAEKFVPNPFSEDPGSRMYRTGDWGRWRSDGQIEFIGRKDDQVKIRGYRIELGETERAVQQFKGIKQAAVLAKTDPQGEKRLIGYVVPDGVFNRRALLDYLNLKLPSFMVPSDWVRLEALPMTPNGKIDKKALLSLGANELPIKPYVAPRNKTEKDLAKIWKRLLKLERVGVHDNFFEVGGHSLLAFSFITAVRKHFMVELKVKDLFKFPTIAGITAHFPLTGEWKNPATVERIQPRPESLPLSYSQESLWFIDQLEGSTQYHIPTILRISGHLNQEALGRALKKIVERHEVLRTVIRKTEGLPSQHILEVDNWNFSVIDGKEWDAKSERLKKQIAQIIHEPFDLAHDYMLRAGLIRLDQQNHVLVLSIHHIASDGWSIHLLFQELIDLYQAYRENKEPDLSPLPVQYADYALWQRKHLSGEPFLDKLNYWKEKLRDLRPFQLPTDFLRPIDLSTKGTFRTFSLDKQLSNQLLSMSQEQGATLFMTLLSAFKALLYRYSSQEDICVGTATAGRQQQEIKNLIGYFINPLPLRTRVDGKGTFYDLLNGVKTTSLEAFENQEVPFEKIVAEVATQRDLGKNPLFQVMFVLQNLPEIPDLDLGQVKFSEEPFTQTTSKFDLTLIISETALGLEGTVEYRTDLYQESTIDHLITSYRQLLKSIVSDPFQSLDTVDVDEKRMLGFFPQQDFNPITDFPEFQPIHTLIEQSALKMGERTAVSFRGKKCSYWELNERANQLAHCLIQKGLNHGDIVGIVMDRSIEMVMAILATLKAGGAYLPIDTDYPTARIEYMLKDSSKMHITHKAYQHKNLSGSTEIVFEDFAGEREKYSTGNPNIPIKPNNAAYIIYTSGSTGNPKGVVLEHYSLFNFLHTVSKSPGISQGDKILAVSSVSFDIAILELLLPFVYGAQTFILDKYQRKDPDSILELIEKEQITLMFATPTHWKMMLDSGWQKPFPEFNIISGGEAMTNSLAGRLLPLCRSLYNIYGPTETTVYSTIKEIKNPGEKITIGKPVINTNIYILNERLEPVGVEREGEICISGHGVAKGYLNRSELTAERFLKDPFHPSGNRRMYRTGDLGKFLPNGEIVLLGRKDFQVKLRGQRIELGEIEHALAQLEAIKDVIVTVREDVQGHPMLVAYLILSIDKSKSQKTRAGKNTKGREEEWVNEIKQWKRELSFSLPSFMVPTNFVIMDNFPKTASGKINRQALPKPIYKSKNSTYEQSVAETPEEKLIAGIWNDALGIEQVDITDNFFEIGGNSLIAVQVMTRLEKESGLKLPLSILFKYPTVQKLAMILKSEEKGTKEWNSLVPIKPQGHKPPLYIVHGAGLNVLPFYSIAKNMDPDQPVYGLQAKGLNGIEEPLTTVEAIASHYIAEIVEHNPKGPYNLAGYSFGGIIAFEMAKQLKAAGEQVNELIMFDAYAYQSDHRKSWLVKLKNRIRYSLGKRIYDIQLLIDHPEVFKNLKNTSLKKKVDKILHYMNLKESPPEPEIIKIIKKIEAINKQATQNYLFTKYEGSLHLFRAKIRTLYLEDPIYLGWKPLVDQINIIEVEGKHTTMFTPPNDKTFAKSLQEILDG